MMPLSPREMRFKSGLWAACRPATLRSPVSHHAEQFAVAGINFLKLRSCLLIICMAVVPLAAMFSHKIPRPWRLAAQRFARGEGFASGSGVARGGEIARTEEPMRALEPPAPPGATPGSPPPAAPPATAAAELPITGATDGTSLVRIEIERQLAALGAVAFECTGMQTGGLHRCSCRVPADLSGQLHRVFQSSNPDPVVALRNLLGQVQFWKHRMGTQVVSETQPTDRRTIRR